MNPLDWPMRRVKRVTGAGVAITVIATMTALVVQSCSETKPKAPFPTPGSVVNVGLMTDLPGWSRFEPSSNVRSGFQYDLMSWLANEMNFKAVPVDVTFEQRIPAIQDGRIHVMLANLAITDARREQVTFAGPYMINEQSVMTRKSGVRIRKAEEMADKTVCTMSGTTSMEILDKRLGGRINVVVRSGLAQCVEELRTGRVDAVSTAHLNLVGFAQEDKNLKVEGFHFGEQDRFGIGLRHGDVKSCELFRIKLRGFLTSGAWDTFFKKYFPNEPPDQHKPDPNNLLPCTPASANP
ncbi:substrate-binding periplasmic protein [Actinomadura kijaniata]|uniref:substrate-binding periplasmic protein n=1 Tax=Actinomadura kijaniata TaxID=46161 RepID=UPI003F19EFC3